MRWWVGLLFVTGCQTSEPGVAQPYSDECKAKGLGPIRDASGTFEVVGPEDAPPSFAVGTEIGATGSLLVHACVGSLDSELLDRLNLDLELVLFDLDDQPIDLPVNLDATTVNVLWGTVSDWDEVTSWTGGGGFLTFQRGSSSFSEMDKDGRLVGTIDVTETDPAGTPMTVNLDLTW